MTGLPALGPRGEGWVVGQLALAGLVLASGSAGPAWSGAPRAATTAAGLALFAGGGTLVVRAVRDLGRSLTPLPYPRDDAELVASGTYGLVRHPIYGGLVAMSAGWALLTASPATLALVPATAAFFALKARREEAWLEHRFPGYREYRARTRRFLPGVW